MNESYKEKKVSTCTSYLSCCSNKIPDQHNLRKGVCVLAQSVSKDHHNRQGLSWEGGPDRRKVKKLIALHPQSGRRK